MLQDTPASEWKLEVQHPEHLTAEQVVERLSIRCSTCELHELHDDRLPGTDWVGLNRQVVCVDMQCTLDLDLNDGVAFDVRGTNFVSRLIDQVALRDVKIDARVRLYLNPAARVLRGCCLLYTSPSPRDS